MEKTQAQTTGTMKLNRMSPSKPIKLFHTSLSLHLSLYGLTKERKLEEAKGEANIQWSKCENYKWAWENAVKGSITFYAQYNNVTDEFQVAVTAQFEPEDLTYYYIRFGA